MTFSRDQRFGASRHCPICGGFSEMKPGRGERCWGALSSDGTYAVCMREERAGGIKQHAKTGGYHHKLTGRCACGEEHGGAEIRDIGTAAREEVASYDYRDEAGRLIYQVVRFRPKTFRQRRPDGAGGWAWNLQGVDMVPYRLPAVIAGVAAGDRIWCVEGEKDADRLHALGEVATCNAGGSGKWRAEFSRYFRGADVVIVRDKDEPGTNHARDVFRHLRPVARSIRVVEARQGKDVSDHLDAGLELSALVSVYPAEDLRRSDPVAWKRRELRMGFDTTEPIREVDPDEALAREPEPKWPTGFAGDPVYELPNLRGVVIVAGVPSSGKSYFALASGIDAARSGWDVIYLSAEMAERPFAKRLRALLGEESKPDTFHHVDVSYGASVETLLAWIEERISARPTLVIFDSLSSFCDQAEAQDSNDPHNATLSKKLIMWAVNVRRATDGEIAFLMLAEASKEGRIRGRTGDHKADVALLMEIDAKVPGVKTVTVTKAWEYQTGRLGEFGLDVQDARLRRL